MGIKYIKAEWAGYMDVNYESGRMKSYCIDAIPKTVQTWLNKHPKEAASVYGGMLDAIDGRIRVDELLAPLLSEYKKTIQSRCVDNPYLAKREIVDVMIDDNNLLKVIDSLGGAVSMYLYCVDEKTIAWLDEHVDKATKIYEEYKNIADWLCEYHLEHDMLINLGDVCKDLWFIADQEAKIERRRQEEEV